MCWGFATLSIAHMAHNMNMGFVNQLYLVNAAMGYKKIPTNTALTLKKLIAPINKENCIVFDL